MEKHYSIKQASEKFGMSQAWYRKLISNRQIQFTKVGRAVRLTESAIKEYFDENSKTVESK